MSALRVLVVAEHASVRLGGEAILPYHYFRLLRARGVDAHLIVHERTRTEVMELFSEEPERLHFVRDKWLQKLFYQMGKVLPRRIDEATFGLANQMLTQGGQRGLVRALIGEHTVIHQPIPVAPRFPSALGGLGAPLVVGPLNGGMEYPPGMAAPEGGLGRLALSLARGLTDVGNAVFSGKRKAAVVLVANERTRLVLPSGLRGKVVELAENGVDMTRWVGASEESGARFCFIGRLVDWKALDVALDALREVPEAEVDVVGDGAMRGAWEQYADERGVSSRVRFHGWLSQTESAEVLKRCGALVLPSVSECGGAVVLEAMAMGKPVIATAWGGPLDYLDATCGILVAPESRQALVRGFADAMRLLGSDALLRAQLGAAGRTRVLTHFDWEKKMDRMMEVYEGALSSGLER